MKRRPPPPGQDDMFGESPPEPEFPPYQRHSATSRAAAAQAQPTMNALQARVFAYLRTTGGSTDHEMQAGLDLNPSTQRPRRIELVEKGFVIDSGERRKTPANRDAVVWKIKEKK